MASILCAKWLKCSGEKVFTIITGMMAKHWMNIETGFYISFFLFSSNLVLLLFHIKWELSLISKLCFAN